MYTSLDGSRAYVGWTARLRRHGAAIFLVFFVVLILARGQAGGGGAGGGGAAAVKESSEGAHLGEALGDDEGPYGEPDDGAYSTEGSVEDEMDQYAAVDFRPRGKLTIQSEDEDDEGNEELREVRLTKPKERESEEADASNKVNTPGMSIPTQSEDDYEPEDLPDTDVEEEPETFEQPLTLEQMTDKQKSAMCTKMIHGTSSPSKIHLLDIPMNGMGGVGSTIKRWMERQSNFGGLFEIKNNKSDDDLTCPEGSLDSALLIGRGYGFCKEASKRPEELFSVAVFRAPIARMAAWFDSSREDFIDDLDKFFILRKSKEAFAELVKKYNATEEIEPGERILRDIGAQQVQYLCGYACKQSDKEATQLAKAERNLRALGALAIYDDINALVTQLKLSFPDLVPPPFRKFPKDSIRRPSTVDEGAKAVLSQWAATDIAFYATAKSYFVERLQLLEYCRREK